MNYNKNIGFETIKVLISIFLAVIPEDQRDFGKEAGKVQFMSQMERAWWALKDLYDPDREFQSLKLKEFMYQMCRYINYLKIWHIPSLAEFYFKYKKRVPTCGTIIFDREESNSESSILLVKDYWYRTWNFPKGKIHHGEEPLQCAIRETKEEINFDVSDGINENLFVEYRHNEELCRLYIVSGISKKMVFHPNFQGEVEEIKWFPRKELPYELHPMVRPILKKLGETWRRETPHSWGEICAMPWPIDTVL